MRKWISIRYSLIFVITVILVCVLYSGDIAYGDEIIPASEFGDIDLYNYAIENFDTNGNGLLEHREAQAVTEIDLYTRIAFVDKGNINDLTSLEGLEHFVNLKSFSLQGVTSSPITDISVFTNFPKMTELRIRNQHYIEDFSVIRGLTELQILDFWLTNCGDVSFVKNMKELRIFSLAGGELKNQEVIGRLTNLIDLSLYNCGLTDISFLENIDNLQMLSIGENSVTDFSILAKYKDMWSLSIGGKFEDDGNGGAKYVLTSEQLEFLSELTNLQELLITDCGLEELPDLTGLTKLNRIVLFSNYLDSQEVYSKLPASITSSTTWIEDTGVHVQREKINNEMEVTTEQETELNTEKITEATTEITIETSVESTRESYSEKETESKIKQETMTSEDTSMKENEDEKKTSTMIDRNEENEEYYNIEILGEFDSKVYLVAEEKRNLKEYENIINKLMKDYENAVDIQVYDISAHDVETDKKLQPNGKAKISLTFNEVEGCEYIVFELAENGDYKEIRSYLSDAKLHFYTENINSYMIITLDESGVYKEKGKESEGRLPIILTVMGVIVVLVGAVLIIIEERRKNR